LETSCTIFANEHIWVYIIFFYFIFSVFNNICFSFSLKICWGTWFVLFISDAIDWTFLFLGCFLFLINNIWVYFHIWSFPLYNEEFKGKIKFCRGFLLLQKNSITNADFRNIYRNISGLQNKDFHYTLWYHWKYFKRYVEKMRNLKNSLTYS